MGIKVIFIALMLTGCSASEFNEALSPNHPANPSAQEAPIKHFNIENDAEGSSRKQRNTDDSGGHSMHMNHGTHSGMNHQSHGGH